MRDDEAKWDTTTLFAALEDGTTLLREACGESDSAAVLLARWIARFRGLYHIHLTKKGQSYSKFGRGDVVNVDFGFTVGNELRGPHPAVVMNEDTWASSTITVLPLSSKLADHYTEVDLGRFLNPDVDSAALVGQIRTVSKLRVIGWKPIGHVEPDDYRKLSEKLLELYCSVPAESANSLIAATQEVRQAHRRRPRSLPVPRRTS